MRPAPQPAAVTRPPLAALVWLALVAAAGGACVRDARPAAPPLGGLISTAALEGARADQPGAWPGRLEGVVVAVGSGAPPLEGGVVGAGILEAGAQTRAPEPGEPVWLRVRADDGTPWTVAFRLPGLRPPALPGERVMATAALPPPSWMHEEVSRFVALFDGEGRLRVWVGQARGADGLGAPGPLAVERGRREGGGGDECGSWGHYGLRATFTPSGAAPGAPAGEPPVARDVAIGGHADIGPWRVWNGGVTVEESNAGRCMDWSRGSARSAAALRAYVEPAEGSPQAGAGGAGGGAPSAPAAGPPPGSSPGCRAPAECADGALCCEGACAVCCADEDCPAGAVCRAGRCDPDCGCTSDADCAPGDGCFDCRCVRLPACASAADCPSARVCCGGVCALCCADADCPDGARCGGGTCRR